MISCNKDCCQCVTDDDDAESTGSAVLFDPTNEEYTDDKRNNGRGIKRRHDFDDPNNPKRSHIENKGEKRRHDFDDDVPTIKRQKIGSYITEMEAWRYITKRTGRDDAIKIHETILFHIALANAIQKGRLYKKVLSDINSKIRQNQTMENSIHLAYEENNII